MNTETNILIVFILNLVFSIFEIVGGIFTGSVAIISDAMHDIGDAASIGISYLLEKKSKKQPDEKYTYGYARYSVLGSLITTSILILGSVAVIFNAINRIIKPTEIKYTSMIIFAIAGVCINLCAAHLTHNGKSLNQKAVNLHMLEDVLGWLIVLIGSIVMHFTDFSLIDPIMSICISMFILAKAICSLKEAFDLLLEKAPHDVNIKKIKEYLSDIDGIIDIHHIHIWSMDGQNHYATMHIVTDKNTRQIKVKVREKLIELGIFHTTLELETTDEHCHNKYCRIDITTSASKHHHH